MKHVIIRDVAKKLNVSVSFVSKEYNDRNDIKKETKELILKVGKEMEYHPNPIAKKFSQQKSFNVGVVVPEFINAFSPKIFMAFLFSIHARSDGSGAHLPLQKFRMS